MLKPLPPDYVRPTLAEYLAASKTHKQAEYLKFVQGHEDELRKHYQPAAVLTPEPVSAPEPEFETPPPESAESEAETQTEENDHEDP